MGWHLRFAKTDRVEILTSKAQAGQALGQRHIHTDWDFELVDENDHVRAVIRRKRPLHEGE